MVRDGTRMGPYLMVKWRYAMVRDGTRQGARVILQMHGILGDR
jgi:hypothetical protein